MVASREVGAVRTGVWETSTGVRDKNRCDDQGGVEGGAGEVRAHVDSASGLFTQERRDQNKPSLYICQPRVGVG